MMRQRAFLFALVALASLLSLASCDLEPSLSRDQQSESLQKSHSHDPQSSYENALALLRSTIKAKPRLTKQHTQQPKTTSHSSKDGADTKQRSGPESGAHFSFWDMILHWTPIGRVYRVALLLLEMLSSSLGLTPAIASSELAFVPKSPSPRIRDASAKWLGPPISTTKEELRWPGARPLPLWPDWETLENGGLPLNPEDSAWDSVMFGPFHAGWEDDDDDELWSPFAAERSQAAAEGSLGRLLQHEAVPPAIRKSIRGVHDQVNKLFNVNPSPWHRAKKQKIQSLRQDMEARRQAAINDLVWAGWGRKEVDWEFEAYSYPTSDPIRILSDALSGANHTDDEQPKVQAHADALWVLAEHSLWGTHGAKPNIARARACYQRLIDYGHDSEGLSRAGNASAHARLAFLEGSGWESTVRGDWQSPSNDLTSGDTGTDEEIKQAWKDRKKAFARLKRDDGLRQAKAMLHYTQAAEAGDAPSQMALAFRYRSGIGAKPSCLQALNWYEKAARDAYRRFKAGPPGGLTLPYTKLRLSDLAGGAYGPGASAASTGDAALKPAVQAALNHQPGIGSDPDGLQDMLEYHVYHAERGDTRFLLPLARFYYHGSIWGPSVAAGAVRRDYRKAMDYLLRITRHVWPKDAAVVGRGGPTGWTARKGESGEDIVLKADNTLTSQAGDAASLIGKMYLRGEGVKQDFARAWVWFQRGADTGDGNSYNGLGLMMRDGLGVKQDVSQAVTFFEAASKARSADGSANLAKIYIDMEEYTSAIKYTELSIRQGNTFEAYFLRASVNAALARLQNSGDRCREAVAGFKHTTERGDWAAPMFHKAERAWRRGKKQKALLGWMLAGEMGFEPAQNNVAWILDRDKRRLRLSALDAAEDNSTDRLALIHWTRSAAQDNVDAMVKMGDYYFHGIGTGNPGRPAYDKAAACYSAAADRQVSALAYWNMGWMYEKGIGVARQDFHLAKRYYDMAVATNDEAYLPVTLSLIKLHLRALWATVFRSSSSDSAISLFSSYTTGPDARSAAYTEAEEIAQRNRERLAEERRHTQTQGDGMGDPNEPETWASAGQMDDEELDDIIEGGLLIFALAALAYLAYVRQGVQLRMQRERREMQGRLRDLVHRREEEDRRGEPAADEQDDRPPPPDPWLPEGGAGNHLAGL